ncbi:prepilin peptidase [Acidocella sp.]|uniref:prepilin peptidase n=1 Tax=Acidocella sp. TaxID=50710 RepID=UPI00262CBD43|nr:A24 family peptidase [Acidocella sp.]
MSVAMLCVALVLLVYAALHDLAVRTVPNSVAALLLIVGAALRGFEHNLLPALAFAVGLFLLLFAVWIAGLMGGGDVKLWGASVLLVSPSINAEFRYFADVVLFGGALALLYLLLSLAVPKPMASKAGSYLKRFFRVELWRIRRRAPLPYACAIAGGAFAVLVPQILKL